MKKVFFIFSCLWVISNLQAQETIVTAAPTVEAAIMRSSADLNATLTRLLEEAEKQKEKLESSLQRMGDPEQVQLASVQMLKNEILASANLLKNQQQQRQQMSALTGAEVFEDDASGLMEKIGATFTKKDGTPADRDPERYRMESAMNTQVKEFKRVREEALKRKEKLKAELAEVIQDIESCKDIASAMKLNSMVIALDGEISECNQAIMVAEADVAMAEKELVGHARVMSLAKQEEKQIENAPDPANPPVGGTFPGMGATPKKLPWGRKGSTTTSGGTGEPAVP